MSDVPALTVYQRIMRAAENQEGMTLSVDDVAQLSSDPAIWRASQRDDVEMTNGRRCINCGLYGSWVKPPGWHCSAKKERPEICDAWVTEESVLCALTSS